MLLKIINIQELRKDPQLLQDYVNFVETEDIFFDLDYLAVNALHENGKSYIGILLDDNAIKAVYPFIKREFKFADTSFFDLITPYEYGGVIYKTEKKIFDLFQELFVKYCNDNKIVSEFQRIDPFLKQESEANEHLIKYHLARQNVVVDLSLSQDELFQSYHKNNRRDVRKAERSGVSVKSYAAGKESIESFKSIYYQTMEEKQAGQLYFFNEDYFSKLRSLAYDKLAVFIAYTENAEAVSACLILKKGPYAHYHLSGSNRGYTALCSSNLLIHQAILTLKKEGLKYLHLGGASADQVGLYRFKSKFSSQTIPYFVSNRIFNEYLYKQINEKVAIEKNIDKSKLKEIKGFPIYRYI